ncbi:unnamed protein product [Prorocentrum cordatum]|uniref:Holocytochrome c-type synthase n=1 Tax=Prorocentrum cordatum TaxID=2364126 RepID=A0ABN9T828_9DINO|nr:unnamed protein product [Polarella glacialis]
MAEAAAAKPDSPGARKLARAQRQKQQQQQQQQQSRKPRWDEHHHMPRGGQDCPGMPYSKRRYFDGQHAEFSNESKEEPKQISQTPISDDRPEWVESWSVTASLDNSGIHKHLRHYFDRRGLPSTYRAKPALLPFIDDLQPRSRPSTSERAWAMRTSQSMPSFKSASSPDGTARTGSMMSSYSNKSSRWGFSGPEEIAARSEGSIHWETQRCLQFGPNKKIGEARYLGDPVGKASGKKIPWVWNHHIGSAESGTPSYLEYRRLSSLSSVSFSLPHLRVPPPPPDVSRGWAGLFA